MMVMVALMEEDNLSKQHKICQSQVLELLFVIIPCTYLKVGKVKSLRVYIPVLWLEELE